MKTGLDIAFFGSSLVSAYWNGAATYYRGILSAMHALGHSITFYEPDAYERQQHRDIPDPDYAKVVVYQPTESEVCAQLEKAAGADIIVKASGVGVFDEFLEREVLNAASPNTRVVFWDVDAPATLDRVQTHPDDPFHNLIPRFDYIFTYGGGDPVKNAYEALGAKECIPIYNALDPETHHPVARDNRFEGHLSFLGNRMPDREQRVMEFFFKPAGHLENQQFILGGNGWEDNIPQLANVRCLGHIYTKDHNAFNCTPQAVLNISRESMAKYGFSPATRVFEAAGAGVCLITDYWKGIEQFLAPDEECLVAQDGEEVVQHLQNLTAEKAAQIGKAALHRVFAEHTYKHRAEQLQKLLC